MAWLAILISLLVGLVLVWLTLVVALWRSGRGLTDAKEVARLLPGLLRLLSRLARDRSLPRGVRLRLWLLLGYLASPIDLIPDFIPVAGYADDAIIVAFALRSVVRRAGSEALEAHWSGSAEGLALVRRLAGLSQGAA